MFFFFEYILVAVLIVATYFLRSFPSGWFQAAEQYLSRLARRRALAVLVVGVLALAIRAALLPNLPIPQPGIHDDFGYLLMGDTFAHGRLANPTHPMWIHFESFHINQKPTYGAMFYPAQGLVLALGQVIGRHPFVGVWLCAGAMCAAICWMLQGWLPPGWALLGGLLAVMRLGTFTYWVNSYSGGALAAIGGALVLGALPRIKRRSGCRDALLMGLGLALLANTRPYESLFFGIPIGVAALAWILGKKRPPWRQLIPRIVLPMGLLLAVTVAGMAYFFWRVTGSPFRTPFQVNHRYLLSPCRIFPGSLLTSSTSITIWCWSSSICMVGRWAAYYHARRAPFERLATKVVQSLPFLPGAGARAAPGGDAGHQPLAVFPEVDHGQDGLSWWRCAAPLSSGWRCPSTFIPHYAAPPTAAIYALILQAMRHLRLVALARKTLPGWGWCGRSRPSASCSSCCALSRPNCTFPPPSIGRHTWASEHYQNLDRAKALAQLEALPGDQLVIVRYNQYHNSDNEWVYNRADIDSAKIVWARDMGDSGNAELIRYFPQRRVWLAEPDLAPPRLSAFRVVLLDRDNPNWQATIDDRSGALRANHTFRAIDAGAGQPPIPFDCRRRGLRHTFPD